MATIIVGAGLTIGVSLVADFIESEMSKGHFRTETTENHMTDLVLVGDMHVPVDARLHADNVVIFGNQRFDNVDVKADKVEIVGSISSEGNFIVHAEEVLVTPSENVAQTLLEKAQAEAAVQAQKGADSVQSEQVAEVPSERAESVPAETPPVENEAVIGYDSPENILPDGSRIDDELFFYEENLLLQTPTDSAVAANDTATYSPDTVTSGIGVTDIYDDYIV